MIVLKNVFPFLKHLATTRWNQLLHGYIRFEYFALIFGSHFLSQLGCFVSDFLAIGHHALPQPQQQPLTLQKVKLFQIMVNADSDQNRASAHRSRGRNKLVLKRGKRMDEMLRNCENFESNCCESVREREKRKTSNKLMLGLKFSLSDFVGQKATTHYSKIPAPHLLRHICSPFPRDSIHFNRILSKCVLTTPHGRPPQRVEIEFF